MHALQCAQRARSENTIQKSHRWFCLRFDLCELWPNCTRYSDCDARKKVKANVMRVVCAASDTSFVGHLPRRVHLKIHRNESKKKRTRRASPIWQHCLSRVASHSKSSKRAKTKKNVERKCTSIVSAAHTHARPHFNYAKQMTCAAALNRIATSWTETANDCNQMMHFAVHVK